MEEAIFKCSNSKCLYPFRDFKIKNFKENKVYIYRRIEPETKVLSIDDSVISSNDSAQPITSDVFYDQETCNNQLLVKTFSESQTNENIEEFDFDFPIGFFDDIETTTTSSSLPAQSNSDILDNCTNYSAKPKQSADEFDLSSINDMLDDWIGNSGTVTAPTIEVLPNESVANPNENAMLPPSVIQTNIIANTKIQKTQQKLSKCIKHIERKAKIPTKYQRKKLEKQTFNPGTSNDSKSKDLLLANDSNMSAKSLPTQLIANKASGNPNNGIKGIVSSLIQLKSNPSPMAVLDHLKFLERKKNVSATISKQCSSDLKFLMSSSIGTQSNQILKICPDIDSTSQPTTSNNAAETICQSNETKTKLKVKRVSKKKELIGDHEMSTKVFNQTNNLKMEGNPEQMEQLNVQKMDTNECDPELMLQPKAKSKPKSVRASRKKVKVSSDESLMYMKNIYVSETLKISALNRTTPSTNFTNSQIQNSLPDLMPSDDMPTNYQSNESHSIVAVKRKRVYKAKKPPAQLVDPPNLTETLNALRETQSDILTEIISPDQLLASIAVNNATLQNIDTTEKVEYTENEKNLHPNAAQTQNNFENSFAKSNIYSEKINENAITDNVIQTTLQSCDVIPKLKAKRIRKNTINVSDNLKPIKATKRKRIPKAKQLSIQTDVQPMNALQETPIELLKENESSDQSLANAENIDQSTPSINPSSNTNTTLKSGLNLHTKMTNVQVFDGSPNCESLVDIIYSDQIDGIQTMQQLNKCKPKLKEKRIWKKKVVQDVIVKPKIERKKRAPKLKVPSSQGAPTDCKILQNVDATINSVVSNKIILNTNTAQTQITNDSSEFVSSNYMENVDNVINGSNIVLDELSKFVSNANNVYKYVAPTIK